MHYFPFPSVSGWKMRVNWRWTVWITSLRRWPVTVDSLWRLRPAGSTAPTCWNPTPVTPSSRVSLYLTLFIAFPVRCVSRTLNRPRQWGLTFISSLFLPLCLCSADDWPFSAGERVATLSVLTHVCGQRLPHRTLPRPAVCEFLTCTCTHTDTYGLMEISVLEWRNACPCNALRTMLETNRCCIVFQCWYLRNKEAFYTHLLQCALSDCWNARADIKQCCPHLANMRQCRNDGPMLGEYEHKNDIKPLFHSIYVQHSWIL